MRRMRAAFPHVVSAVAAVLYTQAGVEQGGRLVRALFCVVAVAVLLGGCGSDAAPVSAQSNATSEQILKKDCADPKWKEQNLGLWYSVCRQPLRW